MPTGENMRMTRNIGAIIDKALNFSVVSITNVILLLMAVAVVFDVITRYALGFCTPQIQDYAIFGFIWVVFLTAGKVTRERRHIVIDFLSERFVNAGMLRTKGILDIFISLSSVVYGAMFLYFGSLDTMVYIRNGHRSILDYVLPTWVCHIAVPIGSGILFFYGVRELVSRVHTFRQIMRGEKS
jgi:TRAP-type C4-dicarboxylate transport system permease small subunit